MGLMSLVDVPAPAKLNLFLHVVGRREDGYHLLQSVFCLIDWSDTLHFERRGDGRIARHDLGPALPEDDLCLRAARRLQQHAGTPLGADISILKRVPWGAGLGGGSSDAATTLLALNRLWGLDLPRRELLALAAPLGADVPFFVGGRNAFVEGIGDRLTPIDLPAIAYAVVKPPPAIPTASVFGSPVLVRNTRPVILAGCLSDITRLMQPDAQEVEGYGRNDLQPVAQGVCPDVTQALQWLKQRFGNARMSGSGSAVFARTGKVSETCAAASPLAMQPAGVPLSGLPEGWVGRMCTGLTRHPLAFWAA